MREPRSALKDATSPRSSEPTNESQADEEGRLRPIPAPYPKVRHPPLNAGAHLRGPSKGETQPRPPGQARVVRSRPWKRTVFLVRRSVCSDWTQLESVKRDWNTQTLARSRVWTHEDVLYGVSLAALVLSSWRRTCGTRRSQCKIAPCVHVIVLMGGWGGSQGGRRHRGQ